MAVAVGFFGGFPSACNFSNAAMLSSTGPAYGDNLGTFFGGASSSLVDSSLVDLGKKVFWWTKLGSASAEALTASAEALAASYGLAASAEALTA